MAYGVLGTLFVVLILRKFFRASPRARRVSPAAPHRGRRCRALGRAQRRPHVRDERAGDRLRPLLVAGRRADCSAARDALGALARAPRPRARRRARRPSRGDARGRAARRDRARARGPDARARALDPGSRHLRRLGRGRARGSRRRAGARGDVDRARRESRSRSSSTIRRCARSRELVEAVAAAARLALVNARLHAEVRAQLETVQESRARIVTAADEERRRIERDLHDGAQQRLVALALELRSAERQLDETADAEIARLLSATADELQVARRGAARAGAGNPPGNPHAGWPGACARGAGGADAAAGVGRRHGGALLARDRGDGVLRRLRGSDECREACSCDDGVDSARGGRMACS